MIARYCECGAGIRVITADRRPPTGVDVELLDAWEREHSGPGHVERVTAAEATAIRYAGRRKQAVPA